MSETSGRDYLLEVTLKTLEENPWGQGFFAAEPYVLYNIHFAHITRYPVRQWVWDIQALLYLRFF